MSETTPNQWYHLERRDDNNSGTPKTEERPIAALMLKQPGRLNIGDANNVETSGSEQMSTTAGPKQHKNANNSVKC
jgi:hypothetical protein